MKIIFYFLFLNFFLFANIRDLYVSVLNDDIEFVDVLKGNKDINGTPIEVLIENKRPKDVTVIITIYDKDYKIIERTLDINAKSIAKKTFYHIDIDSAKRLTVKIKDEDYTKEEEIKEEIKQESKDPEKGLEFLISVIDDDIYEVEEFKKDNIDLNYSYYKDYEIEDKDTILRGETALMLASKNNFMDILKLLINSGANLNLKDKNGSNALLKAVEKKNIDIVKLLLKYDLDVNEINKYGLSPILSSIAGYSKELTYILIQAGADVNIQDKTYKLTPLIYASALGDISLIKLLLSYGADPLQKDKDGWNALMMATDKCNSEAFFILKEKIDINEKDNYGKSPLLIASLSGCKTLVDYMIKENIDLNQADKQGNSAVILASDKNRTEILKSLLDNRASINKKNNEGENALMIAVENENIEAVKLLLSYPALNINDKDAYGWNALMKAVDNGNYEIFNLLDKKGAFKFSKTSKEYKGIKALATACDIVKKDSFFKKKIKEEVCLN